jgi:hypothetical protein
MGVLHGDSKGGTGQGGAALVSGTPPPTTLKAQGHGATICTSPSLAERVVLAGRGGVQRGVCLPPTIRSFWKRGGSLTSCKLCVRQSPVPFFDGGSQSTVLGSQWERPLADPSSAPLSPNPVPPQCASPGTRRQWGRVLGLVFPCRGVSSAGTVLLGGPRWPNQHHTNLGSTKPSGPVTPPLP